jgi:hypothetical protein
MVAIKGAPNVILDANKFFNKDEGVKMLKDFVTQSAAILQRGGDNYIGAWVDLGKVYLDVSERMTSLDAAKQAGTDRNQIAIYNIKSGESINTGGTGEVSKINKIKKSKNKAAQMIQLPSNITEMNDDELQSLAEKLWEQLNGELGIKK